MKKSPAFQFYPKDFLTDDKVLAMSAEVRGLYITLLCIDWLNDGFSGALILKLAGFDWVGQNCERRSDAEAIKTQLLNCFISHPLKEGFITNSRLEDERKNQESRRKQTEDQIEARWPDNPQIRGRELRSFRLALARKKGRHTKEQWAAMLVFHGGICPRCGGIHGTGIVKDHLIPIYQGGSDGIENIQPLCATCNASKGPEAKDYRKLGWNLVEAITGIKMPTDASSSTASSTASIGIYKKEKFFGLSEMEYETVKMEFFRAKLPESAIERAFVFVERDFELNPNKDKRLIGSALKTFGLRECLREKKLRIDNEAAEKRNAVAGKPYQKSDNVRPNYFTPKQSEKPQKPLTDAERVALDEAIQTARNFKAPKAEKSSLVVVSK